MDVEIRVDDLTGPEVAALLREHLDHMYAVTPAASVHALDLERLRAPEITFWSAWRGQELVGCGALKQLDERRGEIKSMRTADVHRRSGVATKLLEHIVAEARSRGYEALYLETGAMDAFAPARTLYLRHGFERCGPFTGYQADENSVFMVRRL
jgi:putative acetyltransferase